MYDIIKSVKSTKETYQMTTKLLPAHFATLLPGVIGHQCRCGADDWVLGSIKSRPDPAGYVRLRCKECKRDAATKNSVLSENVNNKRHDQYYGSMAEGFRLQLRRWAAVLQASIDSGEFEHTGHLQALLDKATTALAAPVKNIELHKVAHALEQALITIGHQYSTAVACNYTGSLPKSDVVAAAYVMNAEERYPGLCYLNISYKGVWDESIKRLRPFQTPSWMPTPTTFNQGDHS
jgi:hypothetical protein